MKNWGKGIPNYTPADLMTPQELLDFAMQTVADCEFQKAHCTVVAATSDPHQSPNFVVKKDEKLSFIVVKAAVAPKMPTLSSEEKQAVKRHASRFKADCYFAAVGFGAADPDRFDAGLALRDDAFYANYRGLEKI